VASVWRTRTISLPAGTGATASQAIGGLLLSRASDSAETSAMSDGGQVETTFEADDFGVHWPSKTHIVVTVLLSSQSVDLTVVARNVGESAEPIGIGWSPRFAILDGNRDQMMLHIPGQMRAEVHDWQSGQPTGVLLPVAGTPYDFTPRNGVRLGNIDLDDTFVKLHQEFLDSGPIAEFSDPANHYGLRLTALSPTIKAMRVRAPASAGFVSIEPQFNYPDPFGHEWSKDTDTGMVVLQPGQSTQWKVRLELFSIKPTLPPS
jgi:aldose 1-epimerase